MLLTTKSIVEAIAIPKCEAKLEYVIIDDNLDFLIVPKNVKKKQFRRF